MSCAVRWVVLPPLFEPGQKAVCPRCKHVVTVTEQSPVNPDIFWIDHTPPVDTATR